MGEDTRDFTGGWDYSHLPSNVRVGRGCFFERKKSFDRFRSTQSPGLVIGDAVTVYTWTEFNVEPSGVVEVGDNSVLVGAVIMCAESVSIGRDVIISYNVTMTDCDFHPRDPEERIHDAIAASPFGDVTRRPRLTTSPIVIGDRAWIGIGAFILKGVHVGADAIVSAGAVVTSDVAQGVTVAGNPARPVAEEV